MPFNLRGRSLLDIDDLSGGEILYLLNLAVGLKAAKLAGCEQKRLKGKEIALIFEKDSTRTRTGFEVAAYDQGAHVTYIGPAGSHIGHKETIKDTSRVLGRMYDAIEFRGSSQKHVEELARYSGVPVYNGLTDKTHPTQTLADLMTMREVTHGQLSELTVTFMGDIRNNVAWSLSVGAMKMGMEMRLCGPTGLAPPQSLLDHLLDVGRESGGRLMVTDNINIGVKGADFIYTDVWLSMGEAKSLWPERIRMLLPYQVNSELMSATGNPRSKFMHCLPAFHNAETEVGAGIAKDFGIDAMEVTDAVFESNSSIVFDQAENRMHTIKAVLIATLGG
jgi:ornithine carbamoyltransferase